ncbi:MAG: ROK family protein [Acidobacteriaceae bacterium]|nr:ROK family protein [Acidobacteriaceae bacterium]
MSAYAIGVDLGGTNLRVAAIAQDGRLLEKHAFTTTFTNGPQGVVGEMVKVINQIRGRWGAADLHGVGIGVPGFIDMDAGVVLGSANLPGFQGFPIRDEIQNRLGITIVLENDANAAALGEKWMGAGKEVLDLILITLGTGVGGGIIVDGKILRGFLGMAGEIGHMTVYADGNPCGCGNHGCLEKHASASAIAAMGGMMGIARETFSAREVYELALGGNVRAKSVFESAGRALGIAIANLINLFNFPLYLLSGGPLPAWDLFAPTMFAEVQKRSFTYARGGTRIEKALLGGDAGLFGAAYLPFQHQAAGDPCLASSR